MSRPRRRRAPEPLGVLAWAVSAAAVVCLVAALAPLAVAAVGGGVGGVAFLVPAVGVPLGLLAYARRRAVGTRRGQRGRLIR